MEIWTLYFWLAGNMQPLMMGQYYSEERCMLGMQHQLPYWRKTFSKDITPRCVREVQLHGLTSGTTHFESSAVTSR